MAIFVGLTARGNKLDSISNGQAQPRLKLHYNSKIIKHFILHRQSHSTNLNIKICVSCSSIQNGPRLKCSVLNAENHDNPTYHPTISKALNVPRVLKGSPLGEGVLGDFEKSSQGPGALMDLMAKGCFQSISNSSRMANRLTFSKVCFFTHVGPNHHLHLVTPDLI